MDEPCSALDPIATAKIEELIQALKTRIHNRDRHTQHATGWPRFRFHRVLLSRQIDRVWTNGKIFTNPGEKQTEDYITGRFG